MSGGFVKLYSTILTSSIWLESDATLRVWIAMLSTADENGYIGASIGGLAHVSRVSREDCVAALDTFMAPDPDSRTEDNEGRRIEKADGGWTILNHGKYRDMRTQKQVRDAERIAAKRETGEYDSRGPVATRSNVATEAEGDAEAYTETDKNPSPTPGLERIAGIFPNPTAALPMLIGMTQGMGTPGMKAVPVEVLAEAAAELQASGGDVTPHRFKAFVRKVLERANAPRGQPFRSSDKTARSHAALQEFLAETEITDAEVITDGN